MNKLKLIWLGVVAFGLLLAVGVIPLATYTPGPPMIEEDFAFIRAVNEEGRLWAYLSGEVPLYDKDGAFEVFLVAYDDVQVTNAEIWFNWHVIPLSQIGSVTEYPAYRIFRFGDNFTVEQLKGMVDGFDWDTEITARYVAYDSPTKSTDSRSNYIDTTYTFVRKGEYTGTGEKFPVQQVGPFPRETPVRTWQVYLGVGIAVAGVIGFVKAKK